MTLRIRLALSPPSPFPYPHARCPDSPPPPGKIFTVVTSFRRLHPPCPPQRILNSISLSIFAPSIMPNKFRQMQWDALTRLDGDPSLPRMVLPPTQWLFPPFWTPAFFLKNPPINCPLHPSLVGCVLTVNSFVFGSVVRDVSRESLHHALSL